MEALIEGIADNLHDEAASLGLVHILNELTRSHGSGAVAIAYRFYRCPGAHWLDVGLEEGCESGRRVADVDDASGGARSRTPRCGAQGGDPRALGLAARHALHDAPVAQRVAPHRVEPEAGAASGERRREHGVDECGAPAHRQDAEAAAEAA